MHFAVRGDAVWRDVVARAQSVDERLECLQLRDARSLRTLARSGLEVAEKANADVAAVDLGATGMRTLVLELASFEDATARIDQEVVADVTPTALLDVCPLDRSQDCVAVLRAAPAEQGRVVDRDPTRPLHRDHSRGDRSRATPRGSPDHRDPRGFLGAGHDPWRVDLTAKARDSRSCRAIHRVLRRAVERGERSLLAFAGDFDACLHERGDRSRTSIRPRCRDLRQVALGARQSSIASREFGEPEARCPAGLATQRTRAAKRPLEHEHAPSRIADARGEDLLDMKSRKAPKVGLVADPAATCAESGQRAQDQGRRTAPGACADALRPDLSSPPHGGLHRHCLHLSLPFGQTPQD